MARIGSSPGLSPGKEVADRRGNLFGVRLERKVSGVEETEDCSRNVSLECPTGRKNGSLLARTGEERPFVGAEVA
jgi:hypothetical protein